MPSPRPRLSPAVADVRRAVRTALAELGPERPKQAGAPTRDGRTGPVAGGPAAAGGAAGGGAVAGGAVAGGAAVRGGAAADVLVALSGGPDSLALAAATAFEAPRAGLTAGAIVVDHGLQAGSAAVARQAAAQAESLGLAPVLVQRVTVRRGAGPEADARNARYAALAAARDQAGAAVILLGHTRDDQAETVLLGLGRGSGPAALAGMASVNGFYRRPLLELSRAVTVAFCADSGLQAWEDPQNSDPRFARVRVRRDALPALERALGPGVAAALARSATQLQEDAAALDHLAAEWLDEIVEHAEAGLSLPVAGLTANPAALRQRVIRLAALGEFGISLSRGQTLAVAALVTAWHGQGPVDVPGVRVERRGNRLYFAARTPTPPEQCRGETEEG